MAETSADPGFGSYGALLRRRRVWILTIVPAALLLSVFLAFSLQAKYRSTATIILEEGSIAEDLIQSTVRSSRNQEIEIVQGRAMTIDALKALVAEVDPYPNEPWDDDQKAQEIILNTELERVDPVTFKPLEDSPAFSLHYQNPDPVMAQVITQRLADLFLTYHQRVRQDAARAGARLLQNRATELSSELAAVDEQFARLQAQYGGAVPDGSGRAEDARYRAARDLDDLERELRQAREKESLLEVELAATSPNLLAARGDLKDLATVRAELADARQRYTPDHPDVRRLERALETLLAESGTSVGDAGPNNPEYRRISQQLSSARNDVAALQAAVARARSQVDRYTAQLYPSAEVARRVADLERRRSALQDEFQTVQGRLKSAELGQIVEAEETHSERFALIRAPWVASSPYSPNRIGVILLGLVLGAAIAAIAVAIAESTDATVRGSRDVMFLGDVPLLGKVSDVVLPHEQRRHRMVWGAVAALYVLAAVLVGSTVLKSSLTKPTSVAQAAP
jgi:succinoglycan biosynthesis transport protein ExoP